MTWCPLKCGWSSLIFQVLFWSPVLMTIDLAIAHSQEFPDSGIPFSLTQASWNPPTFSELLYILCVCVCASVCVCSHWCPLSWTPILSTYFVLQTGLCQICWGCYHVYSPRQPLQSLITVLCCGATALGSSGVSLRALWLAETTREKAGDFPKVTSFSNQPELIQYT